MSGISSMKTQLLTQRRIARLLADKLRESGWEDDLKDLAKGMSGIVDYEALG